MGEHVVVEIVDVHGRDSPVEIGRHAQREELPHPDRKDDLEPEPPQSLVARASRMARQPEHEARQLHRRQPDALGDDPAEEHDRRPEPEQGKAGARRLHEPRERQQAVLGSAREHAAIARAALEDSPASLGVSCFDEVRRARLGEVELSLGALVVVVKAWNIGLDPIHGRGLKRGSGGGKPDRHGAPHESPARDEAGGIGDGARREARSRRPPGRARRSE